jgi:hypothetical protein
MSIRKIKRRTVGLMNREEILQTFSIATGEYAGTWRFWRETRPAPRAGEKQ